MFLKCKIVKMFYLQMAHQLEPGCVTTACSASIHGHSYKVEVGLVAPTLDSNRMVVDFAVLKSIWEEKIHKVFDHAVVLSENMAKIHGDWSIPVKLITMGGNPTAETFAIHFYGVITAEFQAMRSNVQVDHVRVWETESSYAEVLQLETPLVKENSIPPKTIQEEKNLEKKKPVKGKKG